MKNTEQEKKSVLRNWPTVHPQAKWVTVRELGGNTQPSWWELLRLGTLSFICIAVPSSEPGSAHVCTVNSVDLYCKAGLDASCQTEVYKSLQRGQQRSQGCSLCVWGTEKWQLGPSIIDLTFWMATFPSRLSCLSPGALSFGSKVRMTVMTPLPVGYKPSED